jgi:hypothetical protein
MPMFGGGCVGAGVRLRGALGCLEELADLSAAASCVAAFMEVLRLWPSDLIAYLAQWLMPNTGFVACQIDLRTRLAAV